MVTTWYEKLMMMIESATAFEAVKVQGGALN